MPISTPIDPLSFEAFGRFESKETAADLIVPKLLFIGLHLLTVLLGVYKVNAMGLLPTTTSDWLAFLPHKQASSGGSRYALQHLGY